MSGRIAVAMSGGVDSSVAAALLAEQGLDVVGVTLQLWDYSDTNLAEGRGRCCSPADIADARTVADADRHPPLRVRPQFGDLSRRDRRAVPR